MRSVSALAALSLTLAACGGQAPARKQPPASAAAPRFGPEFWDTWGDGFAELSTYDLQIPRYGEMRNGEAILIFVSENFSESERVQAEPGKRPKSDEFPAMKMNWQKNFQTGVYDYSEMLSAFLGLGASNGRAPGALAKTSFSRQEWRGHLYVQARFDAERVRVNGNSYWGGDADLAQSLEWKAGGHSEDSLIFWARQMAAPLLKPGESKAVPFLSGLRSARDAHTALAWSQVNLTRAATLARIEVPAGEFEAETWAAQLPNGRSYVFQVEKETPHRILRWQFTSGETGELVATERMKYWELNQPDGVEALRTLGLEPRAPRFVPDEDN
jgi:predicted small lipoprotein YifL